MPFHLTDFVRHPPQNHTNPILSGTTCFATGPITHSALIAYAISHLNRLESLADCKYEVLYITCDRDTAKEELSAEWDTEACLADDSWRAKRALMCRIRICYTPTLQHLFALLATSHFKTHSDSSLLIFTSQSISLIIVEDLPKIVTSLNVATLARTLALLTDVAQLQMCDLLITTRMLADEFETLQIPFAQFSNATIGIKEVIERWCEWVVKVFHRKGDDKKQIASVSAISSLKFHRSCSMEPATHAESPLEYRTEEDRLM